MKNFKLTMAECQYVLVALCGLLCAVSFFGGEVFSLVCLFAASMGMAEVLLLSFVMKRTLITKLFHLMLLFFTVGHLMFSLGVEQGGVILFSLMMLIGVVLLIRFVFYMNEYVVRNADDRLNETT